MHQDTDNILIKQHVSLFLTGTECFNGRAENKIARQAIQNSTISKTITTHPKKRQTQK